MPHKGERKADMPACLSTFTVDDPPISAVTKIISNDFPTSLCTLSSVKIRIILLMQCSVMRINELTPRVESASLYSSTDLQHYTAPNKQGQQGESIPHCSAAGAGCQTLRALTLSLSL